MLMALSVSRLDPTRREGDQAQSLLAVSQDCRTGKPMAFRGGSVDLTAQSIETTNRYDNNGHC